MRYGSVCSGIEAATSAWHPLGWQPVFFAEIAAFPSAVLAYRYPEVPNLGDFTQISREHIADDIDLLVGGTPCQSFSIAGLRGGLADERGNLALEYLRLADRLRPRWLVWENVPGVLSSASHVAPDPCPPPPPVDMGCDGAEVETEDEYSAEELHAFNCILAGFSELGYGYAYRVLDAQHFGVPQRRRRVFVVGYLGDWRPAAAVLFERHCLSGHPAPRRQTGEGIAPTIASRPSGGGGLGTDFDCDGGLIAKPLRAQAQHSHRADSDNIVAKCVNAHPSRLDAESETFIAFDTTQITSKANRCRPEDGAPRHPLASQAHPPAVAFRTTGNDGCYETGDRVGALNTASDPNQNVLMQASCVRRLTPRECERLQGFRDDWTLVPYRGKPAADGPRYKALGNSMPVPCMRWIGERIDLVNAVLCQQEAA